MAGCRWSRPACRWLGMVLAVALAAAGLQAAGAAAALAAAATKEPSSGPVSNAFAMGGGAGGSIDQRTGAFEASLPLVNVAGRAGAGLSLTLSYDQSLAMLGAGRRPVRLRGGVEHGDSVGEYRRRGDRLPGLRGVVLL